MKNPKPDLFRSQVLDLLGTSVFHALGLKESLVDEKAALEGQDMDALNDAVENKSRCVNELKSLDSKRSSLCSDAGFDAGPSQMHEVVKWCDTESLIANRWEHLMSLASECNALNLTNGAIIRVHQQQIRSKLSVLRGEAPDADTYGRHASGSGNYEQRSLAEA